MPSEIMESPQLRAWREELRQQGLEDGRSEGRAAGLAEGRAEGLARAVLEVLDARGIALDDPARAEVLACKDLGTLERWLHRAALAGAAADVFEP